MTDKAQIFLKDITETGFYCSVDDTERLYIYEVINNVIQEWIKKDPKAKLLIDQWIYDYTDYDDRKVYGTSGNLEPTYCNICTDKVYKIEDTKFKIFGNCGQFLVEDKPTYKEQLARKTAECEKQKEKWNIGFQKFCDKDNELQHYKQALDEIEKICKKSSKEWETYKNETCIFHCKTRETDKAKLADKILGVINKAKEKE